MLARILRFVAFVPLLASAGPCAVLARVPVGTAEVRVVERPDPSVSPTFDLEPLPPAPTSSPPPAGPAKPGPIRPSGRISRSAAEGRSWRRAERAGWRVVGRARLVYRAGAVRPDSREDHRPCPEVAISFDRPAAAIGARLAVRARSRLDLAGYPAGVDGWLPHETAADGGIRVRLPVDRRAPRIDVELVEMAPPPADAASEVALRPEPDDPAPIGDRIAVVLTHGFASTHSALPFDPDRNRDFDAFRALPEYRRSFHSFKYYLFSYRPWADYRDIGTMLAREIDRVIVRQAPADVPLVLVGRSGGAVPTRYAAAEPSVRRRLLGMINLCGAMRGSVGVSLLFANGRVAERIGIPAYLVLRLAQRDHPASPGMRSLAFDNFDGTIDGAALARYGMLQNVALREFNARSSDSSRIIAYQGDVRTLWGWGDHGVQDEIYRRVLASFHPSWGTADPLVHRPSGTLAGHSLLATRLLPGRHHSEVLTDPALMRTILLDLYQLRRRRHFQELHPALAGW
jgi:hypothetical protein